MTTVLKKTAKAVITISILTLLSKLLGFIRDLLIALRFGAGNLSDIYFAATTVSTVFVDIIVVALGTVLIPLFSDVNNKYRDDEREKFLNNIINVMIILTSTVVIMGWIAAPYLVKFVAKGFICEQYAMTIKLTRIGFPIVIFMSLSYIYTAFLQYNGKFTIPALIGLPLNICYIIYLLLFYYKYGIEGLMITSVIAAISQVLIQIPACKKEGYSYKLFINIKDPYLAKALTMVCPIIIGSMAHNFNLVIDRTLASELTMGSISALSYANKLIQLVLGLFIATIITVVFPMVSNAASCGDIDAVRKTTKHSLNIIILLTLPIITGIILLSYPITSLIFERGAFDSAATHMTSSALKYYSIGLVGYGCKLMLDKLFYSLKDTKTPMINGIIAVSINIILNLILVKFMGIRGLALATSVSGIVAAVLLIISLRRKIGQFGMKQIFISFLKILFASLIMGSLASLCYSFLSANIFSGTLSLIIAIGIGALIYFTIIYFMKIEDVDVIVSIIKRKVRKNAA